MKYFLIIFLLTSFLTTEVKSICLWEDSQISNLLKTVAVIESNCNPSAVGDGGKAFGLLQIHKACVDDVNESYGTRYLHTDMFNEDCAKEVFYLYLLKGKALFFINNKKVPTNSQLGRMWNGGIYNGATKKSTIGYGKKIIAMQMVQRTSCDV